MATLNIPTNPADRTLQHQRNAAFKQELHKLVFGIDGDPTLEQCKAVSALLKQGRADGIYPLPS